MQKKIRIHIYINIQKKNNVYEISQKRIKIKRKKYKEKEKEMMMQSENILLNVFRLRLNYQGG